MSAVRRATPALIGVEDWWLDWRGECVAIIASGPSTKRVHVGALRDRIHVIAIYQNIELCPSADVVYGCDAAWWKLVGGLPEFSGLKLTWQGDNDQPAANYPSLHKISIETFKGERTADNIRRCDRILTDKPGHIGSGGNSGFQALNLAVQFGATGILLIGFDMDDRSGAHWFGRHNGSGMNNPTEDNFRRWRAAFSQVADGLSKRGIDVVNASPLTALTCFPKMSVESALDRWGL